MKIYLLLLALAGCGIRASGNVTGTVSGTVDLKLDLSDITKYFTEYCAEKYPDDVDAQTTCVDEQLALFLKFIEGDK